MKLAHPVTIAGIEYRVITPRLRGSPNEWAAYDDGADVLQRLVQTASILCDVPEAVLLELDGDDFTKLMSVETMAAREITADQKRRALNFVNSGASIRQAAALSGASIADVTKWRDAAATSGVAKLATPPTASPELQSATRRVRKGPRRPVYVNGVRLGKLALWT
jgi:hypothetical protein